MATTLDENFPAAQTLTAAPSAKPDWRDHAYSWFLVGQIAVNIAIAAALGKLLNGPGGSLANAGYGVLVGQLFLLGLWMAYGGLRFVTRFLAAAGATIAGTLLFCLANGESAGEIPLYVVVASLVVSVTLAVLLPLRALLGWRVDFDRAYHARDASRAMQMRLSHIIVYTVVCAVPCALLQAIDEPASIGTALVVIALSLLASGPLAWLLLAARRSPQQWLLSLAALFSALAAALVLPEKIAGGLGIAGAMQYGSMAAVALNLGLLRTLFDLRLFSTMDPPQAAGSRSRPGIAVAELAYLMIAWPQLPAAVRSELFEEILKQTRKLSSPAINEQAPGESENSASALDGR